MKLVIALGGNALSAPGEVGDIDDQFRHTHQTVQRLANLVETGHQLVITHGNGPQVGAILRRVEIAAQQGIYPIPMELAVADTQGGMGYMISQCLMNELAARGSPRPCATLITTVVVDPDDPDFKHPSKPIGPFYSRERAETLKQQAGWLIVEDAGRGWRRVVPSPEPREIVELDVIRRLVDAGALLVACGGGGIPVVRGEAGRLRGVDAVIDKDRTAALLALGIDADAMVVLTGVERVMLRFGRTDQRPLDRLTATEARRYLDAGEFPPGSMGPKIEAALTFLQHTRPRGTDVSGSRGTGVSPVDPFVLITSCDRVLDALAGQTGTRIVRND
jgi:carbamate kinase